MPIHALPASAGRASSPNVFWKNSQTQGAKMSQARAVLIRSHPFDYHMHAVGWALTERGVPWRAWSSSLFPAGLAQGMSLQPDGEFCPWQADENGRDEFEDIAVVWNRRRSGPTLSTRLHAADHEFVRKEANIFQEEFSAHLLPEALWVNPPEAQRRDVHKLHQLRTAVRVGLTIPPTLISNDADAIADFYRAQDGDIIFKAFTGGFWSKGDGRQAKGITARVSEEHLRQRESLAAAPGIFQKRIPKRDELRITVMGSSCFAARLDSQALPEAQTDWRAGGFDVPLSWIEMPEGLETACLRFMQAAKLHYASFDFIRTPDDQLVFLEVNQTGQFLWKEVSCPEMPLLSAFSAFLASGDPGFRWTDDRADISLEKFQASDAFQRMQEIQQRDPAGGETAGIYKE